MYRCLLDSLTLPLVVLVSACALGSSVGEEGLPPAEPGGEQPPPNPNEGEEGEEGDGQGGEQPAPDGDLCGNETDDDDDGSIDEGCPCKAGRTLDCTLTCGAGLQTCEAGSWATCQELMVVQPLAGGGDCAWVECPPDAPYPIACQVDFQGGSSRGCVAYEPGDTKVYFKEGKACDAGEVSGTITCSTCPADGLDSTNCPINKPDPTYVENHADCPKD